MSLRAAQLNLNHMKVMTTKPATKRILIAALLISAVGILGGCSTAGPFITNISSDGKGNLVVEKNTVHFNGFTGVVSTGEVPTTQVIYLGVKN